MGGDALDAGATRVDLSVRLDRPDHRLTVTVTDNGKGMDADQVKHAFDPFYSADASPRGAAGPSKASGSSRSSSFTGAGVGLGLSMAQGIIASHGGAIALTSQPGRGSAFTIHLPMQAEQVSRPR